MNPLTSRAVLVALLTTPFLSAAGISPQGEPTRLTIEARFDPATAKPGDEVRLVLDAQIDPGYHVYGAKEAGGVPSLELPEASSLVPDGKFQVPDGKMHVNPEIPDIVSYWIVDKTTFSQKFRVAAAAKPGTLNFEAGLTYVACTEEMCDPQVTQKFSAKLEIRGPAARQKQDKLLPSTHEGNHQSMEVRVTPATARAGEVVTVEVKTIMEPGWHNYGALQNPELGEAVAMTVGAKGLEADGAASIPPGDPHEMLGAMYHFLEGEWVMRQKLRVPAGTSPGTFHITADVDYTACDDQMCDPPVQAAMGVALKIEAGDPRPEHQGQQKGAQKPVQVFPSVHEGNHQTMEVFLVPPKARPGEAVTVEVRVEMEPNWHCYGALQNPEYGEAVTMSASGTGLKAAGPAEIPPGDPHEVFDVNYHFLEGKWVMRQKLIVPHGTKPGDIAVTVDFTYTACDDQICDEGVKDAIGAKLTVEAGEARAEFATAEVKSPAGGGTAESGTQDPTGTKAADGGAADPTAGVIEDEEDPNKISLMLYLFGAVGAGLFALVMPCTYPMIPLTVSFFTKQAETKGGRPVFLALAYGGGIIVSYLVLGGLLGKYMQGVATNPWLNLVFGLAFVFFAMSLFGMVELKPPQFLMSSASKAQMAASTSSSSWTAVFPVFLMGVTLCITSFACTAPFLGSMIAAGVSADSSETILGVSTRLFLGMGVFGLTMALPFVVLSLVPAKLPKGGGWMNSAKILFGFVELAAALKFFSNTEWAWNWRILPREVFLAIWTGLFLVAGVYLLGMIKLKGENGEIGGGRLLAGTVVIGLAGYFGLGATGYKLDNAVMYAFEPPYSELQATASGGESESAAEAHGHPMVEDDLDGAIQLAMQRDKLLFINFTGLQ